MLPYSSVERPGSPPLSPVPNVAPLPRQSQSPFSMAPVNLGAIANLHKHKSVNARLVKKEIKSVDNVSHCVLYLKEEIDNGLLGIITNVEKCNEIPATQKTYTFEPMKLAYARGSLYRFSRGLDSNYFYKELKDVSVLKTSD